MEPSSDRASTERPPTAFRRLAVAQWKTVDRALCRAARCGRIAGLLPVALGPLALQPLPRRHERAAANRARPFRPCRRGRPLQRDRADDDRWRRDHRRRSPLRLRRRDFQFRVWPVDRRPLARPRHRFRTAEKSAMPRRRLWCRTPVRRYLALQRRHDLACPQIRLCLHQQPRRLEAGALRKTYRRGAAGNSLRQLAGGGPTDRASGGGLKAQFPLNTALRFSIKACTASRWSAVVVKRIRRSASWSRAVAKS